MIYPINFKPTPRVVSGEHKGSEITAVGISPRRLDIYTPDTVILATPDMLPHLLRRSLGSALKEAGRPGPFIITPEELAEDVTYDPDSSAPGRDKPEPQEVEHSHPKERKLKQELGMAPPETDEAIEIPKHEKFPPSLPSNHPKEVALKKKQGALDTVTPRNTNSMSKAIGDVLRSVGVKPPFKIQWGGPGRSEAVINLKGQMDKMVATLKALKAKGFGRSVEQGGDFIHVKFKLSAGAVRQAVPVHTGPLTKKFMGEITHMLKKDEGAYAQSALNTPKYLATLTFTRKPEAQKAAKAAGAKGFPNAQVVVIFITLPQGQKKKVYAISNTDTERLKWGGVVLTKEGYKKLMAQTPKK